MNLRKLNEKLNSLLEDYTNLVDLIADRLNVDIKDVRLATYDETNNVSGGFGECYFIKNNGYYEVTDESHLIDYTSDMLEHYLENGGMEESLVIDTLNSYVPYINNLEEDFIVDENNYKEVLKNLNYEELIKNLLEDINFADEVGRWINGYDGEISYLGDYDGLDYYIGQVG